MTGVTTIIIDNSSNASRPGNRSRNRPRFQPAGLWLTGLWLKLVSYFGDVTYRVGGEGGVIPNPVHPDPVSQNLLWPTTDVIVMTGQLLEVKF